MFNPKYRILITRKCFPADDVVGLGTQLISILSSIQHYLPSHVWYAADVKAVRRNVESQNFSDIHIGLIGTDRQFIEYCTGVEQFIWGVFLCIDKNFALSNVMSVELESEDKPFRSINCNGILMEIRAFDTTYFGIYTENLKLISKISKIYDVLVEKIK